MVKNVFGFQRVLMDVYIRIIVFTQICSKVVLGTLPAKRFLAVLGRLEFFIRCMRENKYVTIDGKTRIALYVPGIQSRAFETARDKFTVFDKKLPCTTVLISITSACFFKCPHCYQKNDHGNDTPITLVIDAVKKMQQSGIAFFNIEGGEPFMVYERLLAVCSAIDERSEIWVNSTGYGMTPKRLIELKRCGLTAVMFPLHLATPKMMNRFMGSDNAWDTIHEGIRMCHETGAPVALNMCLTRESFFDGTFETCMDKALQLKVAIIQIIKPKPAGGCLDGGVSHFTDDDLAMVRRKVFCYNHEKAYRLYPAISTQIVEEDHSLFGCTAGGTDRFYLNAKGDVQPCEFLNVSFGNIEQESFETIYCRMRSAFETPCSDWLCEKYSPEMAGLFHKNNLETLPLSKKLSEPLVCSWNRGPETAIYSKLARYK